MSNPGGLFSDGYKKVNYIPIRPRNVRVSRAIVPPLVDVDDLINSPLMVNYPDADISNWYPRIHSLASKGYLVRVVTEYYHHYYDQKKNTDLRVGYADDYEIHYHDTDNIVYATPQHYISSLLSGELSGNVFIIHDYRQDELLIFLLTKYLPTAKIIVLNKGLISTVVPRHFIPPGDDINVIMENCLRQEIATKGPNILGLIWRQWYTTIKSTSDYLSQVFDQVTIITDPGKIPLVPVGIVVYIGRRFISVEPRPVYTFVIDDMIREGLTQKYIPQLVSPTIFGYNENYLSTGTLYGLINHDQWTSIRVTKPVTDQQYLQITAAGLKYPWTGTDSHHAVTDDGLSEFGKFASRLPLRLNNSYIIYLGYKYFRNRIDQASDTNLQGGKILLRTTIAVACMIETYGSGWSTTEEKFVGPTDVHTLINIFWNMMTETYCAKQYDYSTRGEYTDYILDWTRTNKMDYLQVKKFLRCLRYTESIIESLIPDWHKYIKVNDSDLPDSSDIREVLPHSGLNPANNLPDGGYNNLAVVLVDIFRQAYKENRLVKSNRGYTTPTGPDIYLPIPNTQELIIIPAYITQMPDKNFHAELYVTE